MGEVKSCTVVENYKPWTTHPTLNQMQLHILPAMTCIRSHKFFFSSVHSGTIIFIVGRKVVLLRYLVPNFIFTQLGTKHNLPFCQQPSKMEGGRGRSKMEGGRGRSQLHIKSHAMCHISIRCQFNPSMNKLFTWFRKVFTHKDISCDHPELTLQCS